MTETQVKGEAYGLEDDLPRAECGAAHAKRQRLRKAVKNQFCKSPVSQNGRPSLMRGLACKTQLRQPHQILRRRISAFLACERSDPAPGIKRALAFRTTSGEVFFYVFADFESTDSANKISPTSFCKMLHSYPHALRGYGDRNPVT